MTKKLGPRKEGRKCKQCSKILSIYNQKIICFACQEVNSGRAHYNSVIEGSIGGSIPDGISIVNADYYGGGG